MGNQIINFNVFGFKWRVSNLLKHVIICSVSVWWSLTHEKMHANLSLSLSQHVFQNNTAEIYFWTGAEKTYVALWDKTSKINRPTKTCDKNKTAYYSNLRHALRYMYILWQCFGPHFSSPSLYFISSPKLVVTIPKFIWTQ